MSEVTKTITNFGKQILARLVGDNNEVLALKIEQKARVSLNKQISALEFKLLDADENVEKATLYFEDAIHPIELIEDSAEYAQGIVDAKENLDTATAEQTSIKETLTFFKGLLADRF